MTYQLNISRVLHNIIKQDVIEVRSDGRYIVVVLFKTEVANEIITHPILKKITWQFIFQYFAC